MPRQYAGINCGNCSPHKPTERYSCPYDGMLARWVLACALPAHAASPPVDAGLEGQVGPRGLHGREAAPKRGTALYGGGKGRGGVWGAGGKKGETGMVRTVPPEGQFP